MSSEFHSPENIRMLWEIILDDEKSQKIEQSFFINKIQEFGKNNYQDLTAMNKDFLKLIR